MNQQLARQLALTTGDVEVSQAVSMEGGNAVQWDSTLYVQSATNVSYQLQGSNDLENWDDIGTAQTATAVGFKSFTAETAVTAAYVRIEYTLTGTGDAVLSCDLNVSSQ